MKNLIPAHRSEHKIQYTTILIISIIIGNYIICNYSPCKYSFCKYAFCADLPETTIKNLKAPGNAGKFLETSLKRYAVHQYKKDKILCEPYRVSKNDWLYKIFRKKGEISEKDFPLFINIFKAFNPGINDIDAIHPGQTILIPLKKIQKNDFKETSPGVVDVPIVEFVSTSKALQHIIKRHMIKKGETISQLLDSEFLNKDGTINTRGLKALRLLNPNIKNVNCIYAGSFINLPSAVISSKYIKTRNKSIKKIKYKIIHNGNEADQNSAPALLKTSMVLKKHEKTTLTRKVFHIKRTLSTVLKDYASAMGGKLLCTGKLYFPRADRPDIVLDLESHPVIEVPGGKRIVIIPHRRNIGPLYQSIGEFWKNLKIISLAEAVDYLKTTEPENDKTKFKKQMPGADKNNTEKYGNNLSSGTPLDNNKALILNNNTEQETLPYNHEAALKKIISFTNFHYIPNSQLLLSFNGISVNVNLQKIRSSKGKPDILVDFGTIYGYALEIIKKKGLKIVSFPAKKEFSAPLSELFTDLGMSVTINPVFVSSKTKAAMTISGLYIAGNKNDLHVNGLLITDQKPCQEAAEFLNQKNIKILLFPENKIQ